MRPNSEDCSRQLTPAIVEKCDALAAARKERIQARLFLLLCVLVVTVPALLVLFGVSLTLLIAPIVFMCLSTLLLLPALLNKTEHQGGISL